MYWFCLIEVKPNQNNWTLFFPFFQKLQSNAERQCSHAKLNKNLELRKSPKVSHSFGKEITANSH